MVGDVPDIGLKSYQQSHSRNRGYLEAAMAIYII